MFNKMSFQKKIGFGYILTALGIVAAALLQNPVAWGISMLLAVVFGVIAYRTASAHQRRMYYLEGFLGCGSVAHYRHGHGYEMGFYQQSNGKPAGNAQSGQAKLSG